MAKAISFITSKDYTIVDNGSGGYTWFVDPLATAPGVLVGTAGDDVFVSNAMEADRVAYDPDGNFLGYVSPDEFGNYGDPDEAKIANVMIGGAGSDYYEVDHVGDQVIEDAGALGTDTVATDLDDYTLAANVENLEVRYGFVDAMNDGLGDSLNPNNHGWREATGNDLNNVITAKIDFTLDANAGIDSLAKRQISFDLYGGGGSDTLIGASGDDYLDGGTGADTMTGGAGNDEYEVDSATDVVVENSDGGYDIVYTTMSYTLAANVEEGYLDSASTAAVALTGNDLDNFLLGNRFANTLVGGKGNDYVVGGWGNDNVQGGDGDDVLIGNGEDINDFADPPVNLADADTLDGGAGDDLLLGFGLGKDMLLGGAGNDVLALLPMWSSLGQAAGLGSSSSSNTANMTLNGGAGDDMYVLNVAALVSNNGISAAMPTIVEAALGGNDTIYIETDMGRHVGGLTDDQQSALEFITDYVNGMGGSVPSVLRLGVMPTEVENLVADGLTDTAVEVFGNASNNLIVGSNSEIGDYLAGGAGNDTLDGRTGADVMLGGDGNDMYIVDDEGDSIQESATAVASTADFVLSSVDYALSNNIENLTLYGTAVNGSGNASNNVITGNSQDNWLFGGDGNDKLLGGAGNDHLYGQRDADTLDGGVGTDYMYGGDGNDVYFVDNTGETIFEWAGQGNDVVTAAVSYSLANKGEIETLVLAAGKGNINATGNSYANTLVGNEGNNTLNGGSGNDTMTGGLGDDTYVIDSTSDKLVELASQGTDTIVDAIASVHSGVDLTAAAYANIENVTVTTALGVTVKGSAVNNLLISGIGNDILIGGLGNDTYVIQSGDTVTELAAGGTDTIKATDMDLTLGTGIGSNVENAYLSATNDDYTLVGDGNANLLGDNAANTFVANLKGGNGNDTYEVRAANTVIVEASGTLAGAADIVNTYLNYSDLPGGAYVLADYVEQLNVHAVTTGGYWAAGNTSDNVISGLVETGVAAAAVSFFFDGGEGKDTITGGAGDDYLAGGAGVDILKGLDGADQLTSGTYDVINDEMIFDSANDTLIGGKGDDWYAIKNGDVVTEALGEGSDGIELSLNLATLASTVSGTTQTYSYTVAANVEEMNFSDIIDLGTTPGGVTTRVINLVGSANAEFISVDSMLWIDGDPSPINVKVDAGAGNDILEAATGSEIGTTSTTTLMGGLGDDTYVVDGDRVVTVENAASGIDTVVLCYGGGTDINGDFSLIDYSLAGNVENLRVGIADDGERYDVDIYNDGVTNSNFVLTGNALANTIIASSGDDSLDGGAGADVLVGGDGDDTYYVDNSADRIIEDAPGVHSSPFGDMAIVSANSYSLAVNGWNVENAVYNNGDAADAANITLIGNNLGNMLVGGNSGSYLAGLGGDDVIIGGVGDDELRGGMGDDTLEGGLGADALYGGYGADHFILNDWDVDGNGVFVADTIHSFGTGDTVEVRTQGNLVTGDVIQNDIADWDATAGASVAAQQADAVTAGKEWFYAYDSTLQVGEMYHYNAGSLSWDNTVHFDFDGKPGISTFGTGTGVVFTITSDLA